MADIFICYRRNDSEAYAGRLHDHLANHFGERALFVDVDSLHPGVDFEQVIERTLLRSTIVLVVIGPRWLDQRLKNEQDYVRREILAALKGKKRLIPILVGGAKMPSRDKLPPELAALAGKNAVTLHHPTWKPDVVRLVTSLTRILEAKKRTPKPAAVAEAKPKRLPVRARRRKKPDPAPVRGDKPGTRKLTPVKATTSTGKTEQRRKKPNETLPAQPRAGKKAPRSDGTGTTPVRESKSSRRPEKQGVSGRSSTRRRSNTADGGIKPSARGNKTAGGTNESRGDTSRRRVNR